MINLGALFKTLPPALWAELIILAIGGLIAAGRLIHNHPFSNGGETMLPVSEDRPATLAIPPIAAAAPAHVETATFGLGCFWGPDSQFGSIPGVVRTRVGYAGGSAADPTYHNLGDHTETVQIDFDPARVTYEELLEVFWKSHSPTSRPWSRQYRSVILYHTEEQRRLAQASLAREEERRGVRLWTAIEPAGAFYMAEDYHQKYALRSQPALLREYQAIYPALRNFVDSTAVARVNGYVGGHGTPAGLETELDSLGLSPAGRQVLQRIVARRLE
mgnify:CR=1 FL=1